MKVLLDHVSLVETKLRSEGYDIIAKKVLSSPVKIAHNKSKRHAVLIVEPIKVTIFGSIDPLQQIENQIENFFENLKDFIAKNGLRHVAIHCGNQGISIPQDFIDWCETNEIDLTFVSDENILDLLGRESMFD